MSESTSNQVQKSGKGPGLSNISPLLRFLSGFQIEIECKNGQVYQGILHSCDDCMNIILQDGYQIQHLKHNLSNDSSYDTSKISNKRQKRQELEKDDISSKPSFATTTTTTTTTTSKSDDNINKKDKRDINDLKSSFIHEDISQMLHIRGSNVRYVHIPSNVNIPSMIRDGLDRERSARNRYKRGIRK